MNISVNTKLSDILSCVHRSEKKDTAASRFFHRFAAFFRYGTWYNARFTRKAVRYYLYEATLNSQMGAKIKEIVHELQKKERGLSSYGEGFDDLLIDNLSSSEKEKAFIRLKGRAPSTRQLFHIHADEFGANNVSLEGQQRTATLQYLSSFLKSRQKAHLSTYGLKEETLKEIEEAISQPSLEKAFSHAFATQKPVLLKGGWRNESGGHAIYYEIIPDKGGEAATFRLYNLGAGADFHAHGTLDLKEKGLPYLEFKGVKKTTLLSPLTLQALDELNGYLAKFMTRVKKTIGSIQTREYNESDIYEGLGHLLEATETASSTEGDIRPMTLQRTGICAWRSLMAFIATKMSKEEYKHFICDIKLQSLLDKVEALKKTKKPAHNTCELVKRSLTKLSRTVQKACKNHFISEKYYFQATHLIEKMSRHANAAMERSLKPPIEKPKEDWRKRFINWVVGRFLKKEKEKESLIAQPKDREPLSKELEKSLNEISQKGHIDIIPMLSGLTDKNICEKLPAFTTECEKAMKAQKYDSVHVAILEMLSRLPIAGWVEATANSQPRESYRYGEPMSPFNFPAINDSGTEKDKIKHIEELGKLIKYFFETSLRLPDAHSPPPERYLAMHKLFYLQRALSHSVMPSGLKNLTFPMTYPQDLFFGFCDRASLEDFRALKKWDKDVRYTPKLKADDFIYSRGNPFDELRFSLPKELTDNLPFSEERGAFALHNPRILLLTQDQQWGRFYGSDFLPPWFKSLRDSHLYLLYLFNKPMGCFQGDLPLDLQFTFKETEWSKNDAEGLLEKLFSNHINKVCKIKPTIRGLTNERIRQNKEAARQEKQIKKDKKRSHTQLWRPFQHPDFGPLFDYINRDESYFKEKDLVIEKASALRQNPWEKPLSLQMSDAQYKTLHHLFLSSSLRLEKAIEFFTKNPTKLQDPDYQTLFEILFFCEEKASFALLSLSNQNLSPQLSALMKSQLTLAVQNHNTETAVFLLRMNRLFATFDPHQSDFKGTQETLRALLARQDLPPEEKSLVYEELLSSYHARATLKEDEIEELIAGALFIEENPILMKWGHPQRAREKREALQRHAYLIKSYLFPQGTLASERLKKVIQAARPDDANIAWKAVGEKESFPHFVSEDGNTFYYPLEGVFRTQSKSMNLPAAIRAQSDFELLFPNVKTAVLKSAAAAIYGFHIGQSEILVKFDGHDLIVERTIEGRTYRLFPRDLFVKMSKPIKGSFFLLEKTAPWQCVEDKSHFLLIDRASHQPLYRAHKTLSSISSIEEIKTHFTLREPSSLATSFESPEYILEWIDKKGLLQKIELPRFKLAFELNKEGRLACCTSPFKKEGFFLSKKSFPLDPLYPHTLLLENAEGKRKLLLPKQWLQKPKRRLFGEPFESFQPLFRLNQEVGSKLNLDQRYFIYDLEGDAIVTPPSKAEKFYLAYLYTALKRFREAARLFLDRKDRSIVCQSQDKEILKKITELEYVTGERGADSLSIRLYAVYLLLQDKMYKSEKLDKKFHESVCTLLDAYLSHYSNVTALRMPEEEEKTLLEFATRESSNEKFIKRLKELDPSFTPMAIQTSSSAQVKDNKESKSSLPSHLPPMVQERFSRLSSSNRKEYEKSLSVEGVPLTQIDCFLKEKFYAFYAIAREASSPKREWLKKALVFASHLKNPFVNLLQIVFDNPSPFPALPHVAETNTWPFKQEILKNAQDILANNTRNRAIRALTNILWRPRESAPKVSAPPNPHPLPQIKPVDKAPSFAKVEDCFTEEKALEAADASFVQWMESYSLEPEDASFLKFVGSSLTPDKTLAKSFQDLKTSYKAYLDQNKDKKRFTVKKEALEALLKENVEENKARLQDLEGQILTRANAQPKDPLERATRTLALQGGTWAPLEIEELILFFGKQDVEGLKRHNPLIDVEALFNDIHEYLLLKTFEQKRARAQKMTSDEELAECLLTQRQYQTHEEPRLLVFEYFENIQYRPHQIEELRGLINPEGNILREIKMGAGKSKVLLPLLALFRANGEKLSTLIVPESLLTSIASDTKEKIQKCGQKLKTIKFDRNTELTTHYLHLLLNQLKEIKEKKEALILTSKSFQCLILKYVEKVIANEGSEEVKLLQEILTTLCQSAFPLIDEADWVLRVLHEVCFSLGVLKHPERKEIQEIQALYEILYTDPEIKQLMKVESDPTPQTTRVMSEKAYKSEVKETLARKFLAKINYPFNSLAVDYLCHRNVKEAQTYFNQLSSDNQDLLALAAEEISNFLPFTLTKECKVKYGVDRELKGLLAIPFTSANTPSRGSQFANPYITMNYTFQYYMKEGISRDIVVELLDHLQKEMLEEIESKGIEPNETEAYKEFCVLKGNLDIPPLNYKPSHIDRLHAYVNASPEGKLHMVSSILLPHMELTTHKMSCNPHHLVAAFNKSEGFSGTLGSAKSLSTLLTPKPEPGIDASTLSLLWKKLNGKQNAVMTINQSSSIENMFSEIHKEHPSFDMLIDAGGYFKEKSNKELAETLQSQRKMPVVFYDNEGAQVEIDDKEITPLAQSTTKEENRLTVLDQSHTTGADVKQKPNAIGLVTIGPQMTLRDLLQSVWRLRGLDKEQRVYFVLNQEVKSILCQTLGKEETNYQITLQDVFEFTIRNQTEQVGKDNFKAGKQELESLSQIELFKALLKSEDATQRKALVQELQSLWQKEVVKKPRELFGTLTQEVCGEKALQDEIDSTKQKIKALYQKHTLLGDPSPLLQRADALVAHLKDSLPEKVPVPLRLVDDEQTAEIEQETQKEHETEKQTEKEVEVVQSGEFKTTKQALNRGSLEAVKTLTPEMINERIKKGTYSLDETPIQNFPLGSYFRKSSFQKYAFLFEGINITMNVLQRPENDPTIDNSPLFGRHRIPLHFAIIGDGGTSLTLLSDYEANQDNRYNRALRSDYEAKHYNLYNLAIGYKDPSKNPKDKGILEKIVKAKFLNGDLAYKREEWELLEAWVKSGNNKALLKELFERHILDGFDENRKAYEASRLYKLLA